MPKRRGPVRRSPTYLKSVPDWPRYGDRKDFHASLAEAAEAELDRLERVAAALVYTRVAAITLWDELRKALAESLTLKTTDEGDGPRTHTAIPPIPDLRLFEDSFPPEIRESITGELFLICWNLVGHARFEFELRPDSDVEPVREWVRSVKPESLRRGRVFSGRTLPGKGAGGWGAEYDIPILFDFDPSKETIEQAEERIRARFEMHLRLLRSQCTYGSSSALVQPRFTELHDYFGWLALRQSKGWGNTAIGREVGRETSLVQYGITRAAELMGVKYKDLRKVRRGRPPGSKGTRKRSQPAARKR